MLRLSPRARGLLLVSALGVAVFLGRSLMGGEEPRQEVEDLRVVVEPSEDDEEEQERKPTFPPAKQISYRTTDASAPALPKLVFEPIEKGEAVPAEEIPPPPGMVWIRGKIQPVVSGEKGKVWKGTLTLRRSIDGDRDRDQVMDRYPFESGQTFQLLALQRGRYELRARLAGMSLPQLLRGDIEVRESSVDLGPLSLDLGETLRCRVMAPSGGPLADASVQLLRIRENGTGGPPTVLGRVEGTTNARGRVELPHVQPSEYWLVVRVKGFPPQKQRVRISQRSRRPRQVVVRMQSGWLFTGRVEDARGKVLVGARIRIGGSRDDLASTNASSNSRGRFRVRVTGQQTRIKIEKEGYHSSVVKRVSAGSSERRFRLEPITGPPLQGRILWGDHRPVSKVTVQLTSTRGRSPQREMEANADGTFEFQGLQSDRYLVRASQAGLVACQAVVDFPRERPVHLRFQAPADVTFVAIGEGGLPLTDAKVEVTVVDPRRKREEGMRSSPSTAKVDHRGRYTFQATSDSILLWKISSREYGKVHHGSLRVRKGAEIRLRFTRHATILGWVDLQGLSEWTRRGDILMQFEDSERWYSPDPERLAICQRGSKGLYAFRLETLTEGSWRFRLLRRDRVTGAVKPLAESVDWARVVAGRTHEYRFRIAENEH